MAKSKIMRRLESGERWWAAEIALRALGLALLGLCAAAVLWLYRSVHRPPPHDADALEYLAALVSFLGWSLGWSFLVVGPGLFKLVPVPGRYRNYVLDPKVGGTNDDKQCSIARRGRNSPSGPWLHNSARPLAAEVFMTLQLILAGLTALGLLLYLVAVLLRPERF